MTAARQIAAAAPAAPEPHPEADRIVAEIAARYGLPVMPSARVVVVPRGVSGVPQVVCDAATGQLSSGQTYAEMRARERRRQAHVMRVRRAVQRDEARAESAADFASVPQEPDPAPVAPVRTAVARSAPRAVRGMSLDAAVVARREKVRAAHAADGLIPSIVRATGLPRETVRRDLSALGLTPAPEAVSQRRKVMQAKADRITRLREGLAQGLAGADLVAHVGVASGGALAQIAKKAGVALPPSPPRRARDAVLKDGAAHRCGLDRAEILRLWGDGLAIGDIVARLAEGRASGAPAPQANSVAKLLRRAGVPADALVARAALRRQAAADAAVAARRDRVAALLRQGMTHREIRQSLGVSKTTLVCDMAALRAAGLDTGAMSQSLTTVAARRADVARLFGEGATVAQIAARLGLTVARVGYHLRAAGISARAIMHAAQAAARAERAALVVPLAARGLSQPKVAAALGLTVPQVAAVWPKGGAA